MSDYIAEAKKATEQYLTALAKVQDDFVKAVAEFVKHAPKAPEGFELPKFDVPAVDLPSPREVSDVSFEFAEKLLTQQRTYTDKLIGVLAPAELAVKV